ncbi:MAG: hypothetical protein GXO26_04720, partial [Crenarchaeota archaeon]|nr:hypothetical protein [Thermoproteota archaeon]
MPRRLIDEIASLDEEEEELVEEEQEQKKQETRIDSLHLEPDLDSL